MEFLVFWLLQLVVDHTKTNHDNEFLAKAKELYYAADKATESE